MKLAVDFAQPLAGHMRVKFRRADARVPEHFLDDSQIGAVLEQMGCE